MVWAPHGAWNSGRMAGWVPLGSSIYYLASLYFNCLIMSRFSHYHPIIIHITYKPSLLLLLLLSITKNQPIEPRRNYISGIQLLPIFNRHLVENKMHVSDVPHGKPHIL